MALCCIGGVCVPYTAVVPLLLMGLKWFLGKLAEYGLLPHSVVHYLGLPIHSEKQNQQQQKQTSTSTSSCNNDSQPCCNGVKAPAAPNVTTGTVTVLESNDQFETFLQRNETLVIKFTATWCRPCQIIGPVFTELAAIYAAHFIEVDVDDLDQIAAKYNVAVMPTFCIVTPVITAAADAADNGGSNNDKNQPPTTRVETLTGSNEQRLRLFMETSLTKR